MHATCCAVEGIILLNIYINIIALKSHLEIQGLTEPNLETNFGMQFQLNLQCARGRVMQI